MTASVGGDGFAAGGSYGQGRNGDIDDTRGTTGSTGGHSYSLGRGTRGAMPHVRGSGGDSLGARLERGKVAVIKSLKGSEEFKVNKDVAVTAMLEMPEARTFHRGSARNILGHAYGVGADLVLGKGPIADLMRTNGLTKEEAIDKFIVDTYIDCDVDRQVILRTAIENGLSMTEPLLQDKLSGMEQRVRAEWDRTHPRVQARASARTGVDSRPSQSDVSHIAYKLTTGDTAYNRDKDNLVKSLEQQTGIPRTLFYKHVNTGAEFILRGSGRIVQLRKEHRCSLGQAIEKYLDETVARGRGDSDEDYLKHRKGYGMAVQLGMDLASQHAGASLKALEEERTGTGSGGGSGGSLGVGGTAVAAEEHLPTGVEKLSSSPPIYTCNGVVLQENWKPIPSGAGGLAFQNMATGQAEMDLFAIAATPVGFAKDARGFYEEDDGVNVRLAADVVPIMRAGEGLSFYSTSTHTYVPNTLAFLIPDEAEDRDGHFYYKGQELKAGWLPRVDTTGGVFFGNDSEGVVTSTPPYKISARQRAAARRREEEAAAEEAARRRLQEMRAAEEAARSGQANKDKIIGELEGEKVSTVLTTNTLYRGSGFLNGVPLKEVVNTAAEIYKQAGQFDDKETQAQIVSAMKDLALNVLRAAGGDDDAEKLVSSLDHKKGAKRKKSYFKMVRAFHPDRLAGEEAAGHVRMAVAKQLVFQMLQPLFQE